MNKIIATAAIFAIATSVSAQQAKEVTVDGSNSNVYLSLNAGASFYEGTLPLALFEGSGLKNIRENISDFDGVAYLGFDLNSYIGVEVGFLSMLPRDNGQIKYRYQAPIANIVAKFPLTPFFAVNAKVGGVYVKRSDNVSYSVDQGLVMGAGGGIEFSSPIASGFRLGVNYYHIAGLKASGNEYYDTGSGSSNYDSPKNIYSVGMRFLF